MAEGSSVKRKIESQNASKGPPAKKPFGHWSQGLLASMDDPELKVDSDDKIVIIKDKYPKVHHHSLKVNIRMIYYFGQIAVRFCTLLVWLQYDLVSQGRSLQLIQKLIYDKISQLRLNNEILQNNDPAFLICLPCNFLLPRVSEEIL